MTNSFRRYATTKTSKNCTAYLTTFRIASVESIKHTRDAVLRCTPTCRQQLKWKKNLLPVQCEKGINFWAVMVYNRYDKYSSSYTFFRRKKRQTMMSAFLYYQCLKLSISRILGEVSVTVNFYLRNREAFMFSLNKFS